MMFLRPLLVACLGLLVLACTPIQTRTLLQSELPLTSQVLINTPYVPQDPYFCGPATVSMLLQHKNIPSPTQQSIADAIFLPGKKGSLQLDLKAYLREQGLVVYTLRPQLQALLTELDAGHSVIVLQNRGLSWFPRWHYALAIGYDLEQRELIMHSGAYPEYRLGFGTFERTWARSGFWAISGFKNQELPAADDPQGITRATAEAEALGHHSQALNSYQAITQRWPHFSRGWFALGNTLYNQGKLTASVQAFTNAISASAGVEVFNNLAYAAAELGCQPLALTAIDCGLKQYPGNSSLTELALQLPENQQSPDHCPLFTCP